MFILRAENTEKADHTVNPRLPGTSTWVVQSWHAKKQDCKENGFFIYQYRLVGVFIQRMGLCSTEHSRVI